MRAFLITAQMTVAGALIPACVGQRGPDGLPGKDGTGCTVDASSTGTAQLRCGAAIATIQDLGEDDQGISGDYKGEMATFTETTNFSVNDDGTEQVTSTRDESSAKRIQLEVMANSDGAWMLLVDGCLHTPLIADDDTFAAPAPLQCDSDSSITWRTGGEVFVNTLSLSRSFQNILVRAPSAGRLTVTYRVEATTSTLESAPSTGAEQARVIRSISEVEIDAERL